MTIYYAGREDWPKLRNLFGLIRSVKIQLTNKIISRAINHLYPLEIDTEVSQREQLPKDD